MDDNYCIILAKVKGAHAAGPTPLTGVAHRVATTAGRRADRGRRQGGRGRGGGQRSQVPE